MVQRRREQHTQRQFKQEKELGQRPKGGHVTLQTGLDLWVDEQWRAERSRVAIPS